MPVPHHSVFFYRPDALPATQPTASNTEGKNIDIRNNAINYRPLHNESTKLCSFSASSNFRRERRQKALAYSCSFTVSFTLFVSPLQHTCKKKQQQQLSDPCSKHTLEKFDKLKKKSIFEF